jgi:aspartate/methionine/tyrosine aminotransferase
MDNNLFASRIKNIREYFFSSKMKEIYNLEQQGFDVINLGIGSPDISPPEEVIKTLQTSAELPYANKYQSYIGIKELRYTICKWYYNKYNVILNHKNEILPLLGSKEGIMYIGMTFLNTKDSVLIPDPGYPTYTSICKILGVNIIKYELTEKNDWQIDMNNLEKNNQIKKSKMIWINYPHMPTGTTTTISKLKNLVQFCLQHNILIIYDNPYSLININKPISIFQIMNAKNIALELNSLSKSYNMSGWRIGMVAGKKEFINNILKVKSQVDSGMYLPIQLAAIKALNTSNEWFKYLNETYHKRKIYIYKLCKLLHLSYFKNKKGIFVWAKLPENNNNDTTWCKKLLLNKHIFITPGSIFGNNGKGFVRISICCNIKNIKKAIERIKNKYNSYN